MPDQPPVNWRDHAGLAGKWVKAVWPLFRPTGISAKELHELGMVKIWQCFQPGKYDPAKSKPSTYAMRALFRYTQRALAEASGHKTENQMRRAWRHEWSIDAPVFGPLQTHLEGILGNDDRTPAFEHREHLDMLLELARPSPDERLLFAALLDGRSSLEIQHRMDKSRTWVSTRTTMLLARMKRANDIMDQNPGMTYSDLQAIRELAHMTGAWYDKTIEREPMSETPQYRLGNNGIPVRIADGEVFPARSLIAELNRLASIAHMAAEADGVLRERAEVAEAEVARLRAENDRLADVIAGNDREVRLLQQKLAEALKAANTKPDKGQKDKTKDGTEQAG